MTKKTVVRPNQRYQTIKEIVEHRRFNEDKYLKEIGMDVMDKVKLSNESISESSYRTYREDFSLVTFYFKVEYS